MNRRAFIGSASLVAVAAAAFAGIGLVNSYASAPLNSGCRSDCCVTCTCDECESCERCIHCQDCCTPAGVAEKAACCESAATPASSAAEPASCCTGA